MVVGVGLYGSKLHNVNIDHEIEHRTEWYFHYMRLLLSKAAVDTSGKMNCWKYSGDRVRCAISVVNLEFCSDRTNR